ncbi:Tudor/PWWP/MBT superfamily protein [Trifolium repens]|nr:Tudor/PWWP/MBT superfamily protein [Trifolium repens]
MRLMGEAAGVLESVIKEYDQNLVGERVEVWWPKDRVFYKGVIESFDSAKKEAQGDLAVLYDDGEVEVLNLVREKWHIIEDDSVAEEEEGSDHGSLDASAEIPARKKAKPSSGDPAIKGKPRLSSRLLLLQEFYQGGAVLWLHSSVCFA